MPGRPASSNGMACGSGRGVSLVDGHALHGRDAHRLLMAARCTQRVRLAEHELADLVEQLARHLVQ